MNTQEMFDTIVTHARTQGKKAEVKDPSSSTGYSCVYRGDNGEKCFVGALITEEFYTTEIEERAVTSCLVEQAVEKSIGRELTGTEIELLVDMQVIHDTHPITEWENDFQYYAGKFNLTYTAPTT